MVTWCRLLGSALMVIVWTAIGVHSIRKFDLDVVLATTGIVVGLTLSLVIIPFTLFYAADEMEKKQENTGPRECGTGHPRKRNRKTKRKQGRKGR